MSNAKNPMAGQTALLLGDCRARRRDGCEDAACRENGREGATHLQRGAESRPRALRQRDGAYAARGERRESRRRGACDAPLGCANGSHRGTRGARNRGRSVRFEGRLRSLRRSTDRNALGSVCRKARDAPDSAAWRVLRGAMRRSAFGQLSVSRFLQTSPATIHTLSNRGRRVSDVRARNSPVCKLMRHNTRTCEPVRTSREHGRAD